MADSGGVNGRQAFDLFAEAVRATFLRWTALNLAVSYQWGDGNEGHKREDLVQQTLSGFATAKRCVLSSLNVHVY